MKKHPFEIPFCQFCKENFNKQQILFGFYQFFIWFQEKHDKLHTIEII